MYESRFIVNLLILNPSHAYKFTHKTKIKNFEPNNICIAVGTFETIFSFIRVKVLQILSIKPLQ